jgi:hypothetical protein
MTGYAVTFNKRHKRSGHLFQNRYKSIVCEEDTYLLELIRYIHLNPLRAGLVKDLKELDKYPWTGHSAIMGKRENSLVPCTSSKNRFSPLNFYPVKSLNHFTGGSEGAPKGIQLGPEKPEKYLAEKTIEEVLLQFGDNLREARRRYRQFVKEGVDQGSRPELQGGGLVRSAGGTKKALLRRKREEWELGDARILGSGDFVAQVLEEANELEERRIKNKISLEELLQKVSADMEIELKELMSPSRRTKISMARAIVSYWAVREMGYPGIEIGRILNLSGPGVTKCVVRGKKILDNNEKLRYKLIS